MFVRFSFQFWNLLQVIMGGIIENLWSALHKFCWIGKLLDCKRFELECWNMAQGCNLLNKVTLYSGIAIQKDSTFRVKFSSLVIFSYTKWHLATKYTTILEKFCILNDSLYIFIFYFYLYNLIKVFDWHFRKLSSNFDQMCSLLIIKACMPIFQLLSYNR